MLMRRIPFKILTFLLYFIISHSLTIHSSTHKKLKNNDMQAFRQAELLKHNQLRSKHNSPPLYIDEQLNQYAQMWAQHLASLGQMYHSDGQYGQNLYYMWSSPPRNYQNGVATQSWYDEIQFYDFTKPDFSSETGHFTQVIWKGSQRVGFGFASSSDGKDFIVAEYDPPGNFLGQFAQNVLSA